MSWEFPTIAFVILLLSTTVATNYITTYIAANGSSERVTRYTQRTGCNIRLYDGRVAAICSTC